LAVKPFYGRVAAVQLTVVYKHCPVFPTVDGRFYRAVGSVRADKPIGYVFRQGLPTHYGNPFTMHINGGSHDLIGKAFAHLPYDSRFRIYITAVYPYGHKGNPFVYAYSSGYFTGAAVYGPGLYILRIPIPRFAVNGKVTNAYIVQIHG
jgi:hypothetical protein